jgi:two-component system response regulator HydG
MARVLLVDDEECIRFTLGGFIAGEGHDVVDAAGFDEAIRRIADYEFDLVIADIFLGGRTGIDFLRECRERGKRFPVIFITGYPDVATASEAVRLGAFDYLSKPIERDVLLQITARALQSGKAAREKELFSSNVKTILRSVEDTIVTVDNRYVITQINEGAKPLCGFVPQAVGGDIRSLVTGCSRRCLKPLEETMETHQSIRAFRFECRHNSGDQGARIVNVSSYPLLDPAGKCSGAVLVLRDEPSIAPMENKEGTRRGLHYLVGKSDKMQKVYSVIESLAEVESSVLIVGESGTGKELVAEALHHLGKRSKNALVKVNCSALSESLLESELFGHVKGAFTGAAADRIGRFQRADGGTIFLDEIGDLSPRVQSSLLRVLQQMEFERVGDSTPISVDVRVIAATNKDLDQLVGRGEYREDLLYRLKVVEIAMPPLRDRLEDIALLVEHFLAEFNKKMNKKIASISLDVERRFREYHWPGNVRELAHALEHACVLCNTSVIALDDLPVHIRKPVLAPVRSSAVKHTLGSWEILQALEKTSWNKKKAAKLLGIDRKTLYRNMAKHGIVNPASEPVR